MRSSLFIGEMKNQDSRTRSKKLEKEYRGSREEFQKRVPKRSHLNLIT